MPGDESEETVPKDSGFDPKRPDPADGTGGGLTVAIALTFVAVVVLAVLTAVGWSLPPLPFPAWW